MAIPTMLPVNVHSIRPLSVPVPVMKTISNVTKQPGVSKTVIIPKPVLCPLLLTDNARTASLITNNVKKIGRVPVVKLVTSTPVLRGGYMQHQTVVLMTILMANAAMTLNLKVVRAIIR